MVLRLADQDRLLWRHPATGAAVQEVSFTEQDVVGVCAYVGEQDEEHDDQLADGCLQRPDSSTPPEPPTDPGDVHGAGAPHPNSACSPTRSRR